jgi:flagellar M-ring protein FliF
MASPKEMLQQIISVTKEFTPLQKLMAVVVLVGAIGGLLMLSLGGGEISNYQVLYTSLNQEDAGEVVAKLKELRIPYELDVNGSVIKVPADKVLETRLTLAGDGLPRGGGVGFEIFDKTSLGTTDFVQKMNYQRAVQGELARTIQQFDQVQEARVHIATPAESVFIEDQKQPSASVSLKLRGNKKLEPKQVQAIVNLVASAVPGLNEDHITVVDTAGRLLFRKRGGELGQMSDSQLEYQQNMEKGLRDKLESMFEEVVGAGKAIARVSVDLDFNQVDTTEEVYDPEGQVVRSEQLLNEESGQAGANPQGIPGVKGNLATFNEAGDAGGAGGKTTTGGNKRNNVTRNYEISKTVKRVKAETGKVKRISVALMVDGTYEKGVDKDGKPTVKYIPRSADDLKRFEQMAKNTVGFDPERGDQIEVVGTSFAGSMEPEVKGGEGMERWQRLVEGLATPVIYLLVAICFVFFVVRPFFRLLTNKQLEEHRRTMTTVGKPGVGVEGLAQEEEDFTLRPVAMSDKEKIYKLAQSDPDRAADLVRRWLRQEA